MGILALSIEYMDNFPSSAGFTVTLQCCIRLGHRCQLLAIDAQSSFRNILFLNHNIVGTASIEGLQVGH